jgi:hypothetical protein
MYVYVQVYGSSEVQQHLPSHVYTFSNVDREWRDLMKTTAKNPAVINVCLKEGEKILQELPPGVDWSVYNIYNDVPPPSLSPSLQIFFFLLRSSTAA